jgi:hypothetical protein
MTKIVLCGALLSVFSASAQDSIADKQDKLKAEAKALLDLQTSGVSMISGPTLKGAPYSAQISNEMVQTLADGNRITNNNSSMIYRDSQGRERREETVNGVVRSIFINDPVEGVSYMLQVPFKEARKSPQKVVTLNVNGPKTTAETRTFETFFFSSQEVKTKPVVEHLGTQTIEGVSAEGTRTTTTIPAGQIGNERPIVTITERWFSPELQVTVMSTRSDPRTGTTTYKLTNINRSEPAPSLFQVPSDYTIHDAASGLRGYTVKPDQQ